MYSYMLRDAPSTDWLSELRYRSTALRYWTTGHYASAIDWWLSLAPRLAGFAAVALAASSETRWLQTSVFSVLSSRLCLATHLRTSPTTYMCSPKVIDCGYALPPTDRVPFHAHTTHSATGASLSPGHVFGTVFRPTCATRTLHTVVSGVNSKRFVLMLLPGHN